jgi:mannose-1-phosphate guanylyltransferase
MIRRKVDRGQGTVRGVVLAAGYGTRLRPLTSQLPKPLLPVCGAPVVARALEALRAVGCDRVAINLHHQGDALEQRLGGDWNGMPLHYSREAEILGTLGALRPLRSFFAGADHLILLNGDSLCRWPLRQLLRVHRRSAARATLLLSTFQDPARHGGGVPVDAASRVTALRQAVAPGAGESSRRGIFAGAQVFAPEVLDRALASEAPEDIIDNLHAPLLLAGEPIQALLSSQPWWDLGTPSRYLEGALQWARLRPDRSRVVRWTRGLARRTCFVGRGASVASSTRLRRSVVEDGAALEQRSVVEQSLILGGARIGERAHLRRTIVAPNVKIPPGSRIEGQLVTSLASGRDPQARDSVIGQLVFTPIHSELTTREARIESSNARSSEQR